MKHPKLDFDGWIYGLVSATIGGGASAVTCAVSAAMLKPEAFNLQAQLKDTLLLMAATFIINGALNMFFYLKQSPLPKIEEETTVTDTTTKTHNETTT